MSAILVGSSSLTEQQGSPVFEISDKILCTRVLRGPMATCWSSKPFKGDSATFTVAGTAVSVTLLVSKSTVTYDGAGIGQLRIEYAGVLDETKLPAAEEAVERAQQQLRIEEHPRWADKFSGDAGRIAMRAIDAMLRCKTQAEIEAVDNYNWILDPEDMDYEEAFNEVYKLRLRGINTFAIYPPAISIVDYWTSAPPLEGGGYPQLPQVISHSVPLGFQWLRAGDKSKWNGTYYERTRTWIGAPAWNEELYPNPI